MLVQYICCALWLFRACLCTTDEHLMHPLCVARAAPVPPLRVAVAGGGCVPEDRYSSPTTAAERGRGQRSSRPTLHRGSTTSEQSRCAMMHVTDHL